MANRSPKLMQRLDKCVSHLTGMSRQQASKAIKAGDVTVDGEVLTDAAQKISIESQIVIVGYNDDVDEIASAQDAFKHRVFMLNKPYDFICADRDKHYRLVTGLFNTELKSEQLHCAGRLDVDTTGLLIVTDDGELNHRITSPKKETIKLYYAVLEQVVPESAVAQFARGIKHPEESKRYQPANLVLLPDDTQGRHIACVQLTEGRYHEVKRLFESVGCSVQHLSRLAIGQLNLGELKIGEYQVLSDDQIELLFAEHTYTKEECLNLIAKHEYALQHGPYTFIPEAYRPQTIQPISDSTSVSALDSASTLVNGSNSAPTASSDSIAVSGSVAEAVSGSESDLASDMEDDPYFDENLDAELDEIYGDVYEEDEITHNR